MKNTGVVELVTNGGKRKMHYLVDGGEFFMITSSKSKKVAQIKADNQVSITQTGKTYTVDLITDKEKCNEYNQRILNHSGTLMKILKRFNKGNTDCVLILNENI